MNWTLKGCKKSNKIYQWSKKWEMEFNLKKFKVMEIGEVAKRPSGNYEMWNDPMAVAQDKKELGVTVQNLSPIWHFAKITGETYKLLMIINVDFQYTDWGYDEEINCH